MNTIKLLHCADIHIGAADTSLGNFAETRRYETLLTFERIFDIANEKQVDVIAIAGDFFDNNNIDINLVETAFKKIASVPNIKVLCVAGNHDPLNNDSPFVKMPLPSNLHVLGNKDECITFNDIKLHAYGRSFDSTYSKGEERFLITPPDDDYVNLMVLHGELKSDLTSYYNSITPDFIRNSGMDYIALGHVHKRTDVLKLGSTCFAYSGCPEGQGFDELDDKGIYIGEISKNLCKLEFLAVSKRKNIYAKIDISDVQNSLEACSLILGNLKHNYGTDYFNYLYKIDLIGNVAIDANIIASEIELRLKENVCFVKVNNLTELKINYQLLAQEKSLKGVFVKNMLEEIRKSEKQKIPQLEYALKIGIKAFNSEVKLSED